MSSSAASEKKPFPDPFLPSSLTALSSSPPTPRLHLYTAPTPNGFKVSILLEELALAYPDAFKSGQIAYDIYNLSFANNDQKSERFLKINPNGRIPALVDDNFKQEGGEGHNVFESISVLIWLAEVSRIGSTGWVAVSRVSSGRGGSGERQAL